MRLRLLRHNPKEHSLTFDTGLDSIRCPECGLVQFCTLSTVCKRCRKSLGIRYAPSPFLAEASRKKTALKNSLAYSGT
jgi:hypothetical protein